MATRASQASSNRQGVGNGGSVRGGSVDVGHAAIVRMAREDTRWFVAAVVVLSLVLFLVLPLSMFIVTDNEKRLSRAESRIDRKLEKLERLEKAMREQNDRREKTPDEK